MVSMLFWVKPVQHRQNCGVIGLMFMVVEDRGARRRWQGRMGNGHDLAGCLGSTNGRQIAITGAGVVRLDFATIDPSNLRQTAPK